MTAGQKVQTVGRLPAERRTRMRGLRRFRPFDRRARDRDVREGREAAHIGLTAADIPRLRHEDEMRSEGSRAHVCRVWMPPDGFCGQRRADQLLPGVWIVDESRSFGVCLEIAEVHITPTLVLLDFIGLDVGLNLAPDVLVRVVASTATAE